MNQRAIELYRQASEQAYNTVDQEFWKTTAFQGVVTGMFAELIVKECIEVVKWTPSQFPNDEYVKNIKEHFGVEE